MLAFFAVTVTALSRDRHSRHRIGPTFAPVPLDTAKTQSSIFARAALRYGRRGEVKEPCSPMLPNAVFGPRSSDGQGREQARSAISNEELRASFVTTEHQRSKPPGLWSGLLRCMTIRELGGISTRRRDTRKNENSSSLQIPFVQCACLDPSEETTSTISERIRGTSFSSGIKRIGRTFAIITTMLSSKRWREAKQARRD